MRFAKNQHPGRSPEFTRVLLKGQGKIKFLQNYLNLLDNPLYSMCSRKLMTSRIVTLEILKAMQRPNTFKIRQKIPQSMLNFVTGL